MEPGFNAICAAKTTWDDMNPFTGYFKDDGSINIANAIVQPLLLWVYTFGTFFVIKAICGFTSEFFFRRQQEVLKEILQAPESEVKEKLLDMGFWLLAVPETLQDPSNSQDKETTEQLLAHFEKKLPILVGLIEKEFYTTTEKKIMESIRKREKLTQRYYKHSTFYFLLGTFLGLGPYDKIEYGCMEWGPKPADLADRILEWRKAKEEEIETEEV